MAGTQYSYANNLTWKQHAILNGPCAIQVQDGGTALVHFGTISTVAQVDTVTVVTAVDGNTYAVDVDGVVYTYVAGVSSTLATIADGLGALIPNGVSDAVSTVTITSTVAGVPQTVTIDVTTTVPTDLTVATTTPNNSPSIYEGVMHMHLETGEEIFRYTGNEEIWIRTANNNVAGIYQTAKVVCSPLVNV